MAEARFPKALFSALVSHRSRTECIIAACMAVALVAAALTFHEATWGGASLGLGVPLDDVFIHFNYARAIAEGHPFEWISGQGYSSGESSPLYPFLLAPGYLLGFRGVALSFYAVGLGTAALLYGSVRLAGCSASGLRASLPVRKQDSLVLGAFALVLCLSSGVTAFAWFSGMESAVFTGALFTLVAEARALRCSSAYERKRLQRRAALVGLVLTTLRPEAVFIVGPFATLAGFWSRRQHGVAAMLRVSMPSAIFVVALGYMHYAHTGEWQAAGAILKLLGEQPFAHPFDRSRDFVLNLAAAKRALCDQELGELQALRWLFLALAAVAFAFQRTRALACALAVSALLFALAVSANHTAQFQYFRYYVPCICLLALMIALGISEIARQRRLALACLCASLVALPGFVRWPHHIRFFAEASGNIRAQQVAMGQAVDRLTKPSDVILVGDAGAIPYISKRHAIDALGLGGYHGLPFARAATFGEGAMLELLERLPQTKRPTHLALFPNWFPKTTELFGTEIHRISLGHNVISGGTDKVLYQANFSSMQSTSTLPLEITLEVLDELDVADIISEREHSYRSPAPEGGWVQVFVRNENGRPLFDAGRIIPPGQEETFQIPRSGARIIMRVASSASKVTLFVGTTGQPCLPIEVQASEWYYLSCATGSHDSPVYRLRAGTEGYTNFYTWVMR